MSKKFNVGDIVVFNGLPDAVRFEVLDIDGFVIEVREENTKYKPQFIDRSLVWEGGKDE